MSTDTTPSNDNTFPHSATYSPEDNKLRLFFAFRIDKPEWDRLKTLGFSWTMKQSGDMVATWTPEREDACLQLAGEIEDEDSTRMQRSADRAERFAEYGDKRESEAVILANRYDSAPRVHGHQNAQRAERQRAKHDRLAAKACNQWDKAEYWTQRTAGVIGHALYMDEPQVRFRRIKTLEAELRGSYPGSRWFNHRTLRLAYERQMLEAVGGAGVEDMAERIKPGGFIGSSRVEKVTKDIMGRISRVYFTSGAMRRAEKIDAGQYRDPTPEEVQQFEEWKQKRREAKPKAPPLLNLSEEDAQRLQDIWNACPATISRNKYYSEGKPATVAHITQARYSDLSKGSYAHAKTVEIRAGGNRGLVGHFPALARIRCAGDRVIVINDKPTTSLPANFWEDELPALQADTRERILEIVEMLNGAGWSEDVYRDKETKIIDEERKQLWLDAVACGLAFWSSMSQFGLTDEGFALARAAGAYSTVKA